MLWDCIIFDCKIIIEILELLESSNISLKEQFRIENIFSTTSIPKKQNSTPKTHSNAIYNEKEAKFDEKSNANSVELAHLAYRNFWSYFVAIDCVKITISDDLFRSNIQKESIKTIVIFPITIVLSDSKRLVRNLVRSPPSLEFIIWIAYSKLQTRIKIFIINVKKNIKCVKKHTF